MNFKYIIALMIGISISLMSCSPRTGEMDIDTTSQVKKSVYDEIDLDVQSITIGNNHNADFTLFDCTQLESPFGILCRKEDILVTDRTLNKIFVFNYQGEVIKDIGKTGNGELEFLNPTGITSYNNNIYVIDALNDRIQILDDELNYISSIPLEQLSPASNKEYSWYIDIIVKNENEIFLTTNYIDKDYANIYMVKNQQEQSIWRTEFNGFGTIHNDRIYFNLLYELRDDGGVMGQSYFLYSDHADEMTQIDVPYRFSPKDIIATDEYLYVINFMFMCLDSYTRDGQYIETIYKFTNSIDDTQYSPNHMDMDENGCFYLTDENNNTIIKVSEKKD